MIHGETMKAVQELLQDSGVEHRPDESMGDYVTRGLHVSGAKADAFLEALDAHLIVLALLRQLLAQPLDAAAGLVVVEEARARGQRDCHERGRGAQRAAQRGVATTHPST